jgi:hypothetical protein
MSDLQRHLQALHYSSEMLIRVLAMLALVAAAGTTGLIVGRGSQDPDAGWQRGYDAGLATARNTWAKGAVKVAADYQRGASGYNRIYTAGRREGMRLGRALGRSEGISKARRAGFKAGLATALPDFAGGWRAEHWYLVRLEPGRSSGSRFRVASRVLVTRGRAYGACAARPDEICTTPSE